MKIAECRLGFGSISCSGMDYSAQIKLFNVVIMLLFCYSSIVSHHMSEKTLFVAHGKHNK